MSLILRLPIQWVAKICYAPFFLLALTSMTVDFALADESMRPVSPLAEVTAVPGISNIWLKIPIDEKVAFSGAINYDGAGIKNPNIIYPAPNLIGFLAAIATHGVIADSMKDNQKKELHNQANKVLQGYGPLLDNFKYSELATASLDMMTTAGKKRMIDTANQAMPNDVIIESHPQFFITQDQRAIVLDNPISIQTFGSSMLYRTQVRVVSPDIGQDAPGKAWTDDQGRKLKSESEQLFAASLDMALNAMGTTGKEEGAYKTIRFQEGGSERMERGQLIREDCNNIIFKSLRGHLMSVPQKNGNCADAK